MRRQLSAPLWSLGALVSGSALGWAGQRYGIEAIDVLASGLSPFGTLWLNALQMAVLPLMVTRLLSSLIRVDDDTSAVQVGRSSVVLFLAYLSLASVVTAVVTVQGMSWFPLPADMVASFKLVKPDGSSEAASASLLTFGEWIRTLVPRNPFEAAAKGNILQLLVFTVFFGVAAGRLPTASKATLSESIRALADAMMIMVGWIMKATPAAVFVLMLSMMRQFGGTTLELLAVYVVALCALLILATLALYPLTALLGGMSVMQFARGVAPAQLVAASTQSSLASLPVMVKAGQERLALTTETSGFVLSLAVSTFKLNQAISPLFKFILLSHVYGIPIGVREIGVFAFAAILLSFGVAGIPRGNGGSSSLPLYLAAGIPVEGVILLEAVKSIPDIFMTTLNVTADMSVATVLSRRSRVTAGQHDSLPIPVPS
jgi:Na+/H+-dicarboxylate symporter